LNKTDKDKWKEFLDSFDLGYTEDAFDLELYCDLNKNIKGYSGFRVNIEFDDAGKFVKFGIWE
jgi:hypothetical protein